MKKVLLLFLLFLAPLVIKADNELLEVDGINILNGQIIPGVNYTNKILTLENYNGTGINISNMGDSFTIILKGDNTISTDDNGISLFGSSVHIEGTGSMNIVAGKEGITLSDGSLFIKDVNLNIDTNETSIYSMGKLNIESASISATSNGEYAISNSIGDITIKGSKVNIKSSDKGIAASVNLNLNNSDITVDAKNIGLGEYSENINIDDSKLNIKSDIGINSYNVHINSGDISINSLYGIIGNSIHFNGGITKIKSLNENKGSAVLAFSDGEVPTINIGGKLSLPDNNKIVSTTYNNQEAKVISNLDTNYDDENDNFVGSTKSIIINVSDEYSILDGEGQTYKLSRDNELSFKIDADKDLLENVYVDGKVVDSSNYVVTTGSTIVTFNYNYLSDLSKGDHTFKATFVDGMSATTTFKILSNKLNTNNNFMLYIGVGVVVVIIIGMSLSVKKKK